MKINIIISKTHPNSTIDANIISFLLKKIKHTTTTTLVYSDSYSCSNASINIFIGGLNPLLYKFAKTNIFLFDYSVFPKSQLYLLKKIDHIFTKTNYERTILLNTLPKNKVTYIGWRSSDINMSRIYPDYSKYLLFCYNKRTDYKNIIDTWKDYVKESNTDTTLHIVNANLTGMGLEELNGSNIHIHQSQTQDEFERLFNECGFHLCLSSFDSFSHYINQSMLSRCIPVATNLKSNDNINPDNCFLIDGTLSKNKTNLGNTMKLDCSALKKTLNDISRLPEKTILELGTQCRQDSLKMHSFNDTIFKETMLDIIKNTLKKPKIKHRDISKIEDTEWPTVSIVTVTRNRTKFFNLAILNFNSIDYPKNKLEWIIYDTSNRETNNVSHLLPPKEKYKDYGIKYTYSNNIETIGASRNSAISQCENDIILFMDDDDYYPSTSIKHRVMPFIEQNDINITTCPIVGTFAINKYISFIDTPDVFLHPSKKYKIASSAFRRHVLTKYTCTDSSINECDTIFSKYLSSICELNWEGILISLVHSNNTTYRPVPSKNTDGCHFGLEPKLFKFITELDISDEELKEQAEIKKRAMKERMAKKKTEEMEHSLKDK